MLTKSSRPVFTYLKSRGFYAGVQVDGTVIIERSDENERFYGERIGVADILAGKARHPPLEIKLLMETIKSAEGRTDVDHEMLRRLSKDVTPGDFELGTPLSPISPSFGIPEADDPDPFGVLALEKQGLEIREAGTAIRPASSQFEFHPSPTSPIYGKFHRRSMDTLATTMTNRDSYMSSLTTRSRPSIDRGTQTEMGTQTEEVNTPISSPTHSSFDHGTIDEEDEKHTYVEPEEIDYTKIDLGAFSGLNHSQDFDGTTAVSDSPRLHGEDPDESTVDNSFATDDEFEDDEEPVIFEAMSAQATIIKPQSFKSQGPALVTVSRPPAPPLPPRSSARSSRHMVDQASGVSPTKSEFEEVDLHGEQRGRSTIEKPIGLGLQHVEQKPVAEPVKVDTPMQAEIVEPLEVKVAEALRSHSESVGPEVTITPPVSSAEAGEEVFHSLPITPVEGTPF